MVRLGARLLLALVLAGCGGEATPDPPKPTSEPDVTPTNPRPAKADDARAPPAAPRAGLACDEPGADSCDGAQALHCRAGSGGAMWMTRGACTAGERCVIDWGCLPLTPCSSEGLLGCVDQELFACTEVEGGATEWFWQERCHEALPCVDGRGCPNPLGIGEPCSFLHPPRCTEDGQVIECVLEGIDAHWAPPEDCPPDYGCVPGQGCERVTTERTSRSPRQPRPRPWF